MPLKYHSKRHSARRLPKLQKSHSKSGFSLALHKSPLLATYKNYRYASLMGPQDALKVILVEHPHNAPKLLPDPFKPSIKAESRIPIHLPVLSKMKRLLLPIGPCGGLNNRPISIILSTASY